MKKILTSFVLTLFIQAAQAQLGGIGFSGGGSSGGGGGSQSVYDTKDSTGSGKTVLQTSPTLVAPNLGEATGTSLIMSGGLNATDARLTDSLTVDKAVIGGYTDIDGLHTSLGIRGLNSPVYQAYLELQRNDASRVFRIRRDNVWEWGANPLFTFYGSSGLFDWELTANRNFRLGGNRSATFTESPFYMDINFSPSGGTMPQNFFWIKPTINQMDGASGITRGIYINPNVVWAEDFRAIEWTVGKFVAPSTITPEGTVGDQVINKSSGTVNFAAGITELVVFNSLVTPESIVFAVVRKSDVTGIRSVQPEPGRFKISLTVPPTNEVSVGFFVVNTN